MSDDSFLAEGEGQEGAAPGKKKGAFNLSRILMFVGIGVAAIGLIVTVVVITMSLVDKKGTPQTNVPVSEDYQEAAPVYQYVTTIGEVRTRTVDEPPQSVVVKVNLGFEQSDKETPNEITARMVQLRDVLRNYFSLKRAVDLGPTQERQLKEELREKLNGMMKSKGIKEILFEKLDVVEM
jgi:flagellar protein FliL